MEKRKKSKFLCLAKKKILKSKYSELLLIKNTSVKQNINLTFKSSYKKKNLKLKSKVTELTNKIQNSETKSVINFVLNSDIKFSSYFSVKKVANNKNFVIKSISKKILSGFA